MSIRELIEEREYEILRPCAAKSRESLGRMLSEEPCDIRTCYQRDRDRILHSKSFRRLKNKTQVFLEPEGDHYRTRLTHTLEVSQIARTISKALYLNEDLTEAIALGHDLGHTPYGHSGEAALDELLRTSGIGRFRHNEQSVRIVEVLEKDGMGLNLCRETVDGIRNHGTANMPATLEGQVVRLSDKIAYINHDIDDAIRAGVLTEEDLPREYTDVLGHSVKSRLNRLIHDIITESSGKEEILQSEKIGEAMFGLRSFMHQAVYRSERVKAEEKKAQQMLKSLYHYYEEHLERIPRSYTRLMEQGERKEIVICDYISGMTDQFAVREYQELFIPKGWTE
ncbi:MAG: deoxyguanosinetriphosphate triphosphohydrolase [Lachnospiraceae bacterium]|nr:deoxyguanosinetriphosphate triphosphohydrolase [Lachnospiraceae bacterium]